MRKGRILYNREGKEEKLHLGLGNDLDGNVLAAELALLGLGGIGVPEVAAPHLAAELVLGREMVRVAEAIVHSGGASNDP
jgi:hypothetical protein